MDNRELQSQRMKGYFIQATKDILKGEGLRGISVRNIANQAGYSYATLYNYFTDIKELIFICVKDFQDECTELVQQDMNHFEQGIPKIKHIIISFIKFFIQYPGIFELFYLESISELDKTQSTNRLIYSFLNRLCSEDWIYCVNHSIVEKNEVEIQKDQITYVVIGMLLFYLNRRLPDSNEEFMTIVDVQLNTLLKIT